MEKFTRDPETHICVYIIRMGSIWTMLNLIKSEQKTEEG